ncbi:PepSY-associated TM helix domain-containing protein [Uliginosibacterium paludis]|uniref:PepSY-associated TM helix domain-containing protein n=1 Tax=Uliginosibacterium paludis TaxID=1615952 RepID=A0ABV2CU62_9RHOO
MRSDLIRIYKSVHTWTGILAGMALFIAFYAGALTVFKDPIARWVAPPAAVRQVTLEDSALLVSRLLASRPEALRGFQLNLEITERRPGRVEWQVKPKDADEHDNLSGHFYLASLDAGGSVRVDETQPSQLVDLIDILHRVVGLPFDDDPARWFMGVIAALYAVALFSGVVVLLPTLVKDFFALRVGRNLKRMWLDAHNVVGIISLPFHIVMAVTAVVFAYHDGIYALQDRVLHGGKLSSAWSGPKPQGTKPEARDPAAMLPPLELVARAKALSPGFEPESLQYLQLASPRAMVRVWGNDAAGLSPRAMGGFVALDPWTGKVLSRDFLPGAQEAASLTLSSFFALHFATFGGTPVRWMYFVLALAGAWLFYSGNLLWVESRRKAQRRGEAVPAQRLDTRLLAAATVGVCMGCVAGISFSMVAGKWLYGHVADLNSWHWRVYYLVFFMSLAWAFLRGPARAAMELPALAAAATLAIPLTSLLGALVPALGWWAHTSGPALGVDLTALALGLSLVWMQRATARRVRQGSADSVWSLGEAQARGVQPLQPGEV